MNAKSKAIKIKKGEFVREHKRLVGRLESGKGLKKEARLQEKELKEKE